MKQRIRQLLRKKSPISLNELKEKRRKKNEQDKENYHKFYARKTMTSAEWQAMQAKRRKD